MTLLENPYLLFAAFLVIGLASRYPKLQITEGGIILELTELFIFLALVQINLYASLVLILLYCWLPLLAPKLEGAMDISVRTVSLLIGLPVFYLAQFMGYPLVHAILIATAASSTIYALTLFVILRFTSPALLIIPFGKLAIYYKVYIPLFLALGAF